MPEQEVLCVSFDTMVSDGRYAALKETGFHVTTTTRIKEALELLSCKKFDLVIVGHRFSVEDKYVLAVEAKEKSDTPVLLVCGATPDSEVPASARVYALEGNAGLTAAALALLPAAAGGGPRRAA
jgi:DNA-binding response OmpR family regulator